jgi:hypothetical protein
MRDEVAKGEEEVRVFERFVHLSGLKIIPGSIRKRPPPEPDLLCDIESEGPVAFEITEACASEFAQAESEIARGKEVGAIWAGATGSATETIRKKLLKRYSAVCPMELIMYTGRMGTPDSILKAWVQPYALSTLGPFRRIWLLGQSLHLLAPSEG